MRKNLGNTFIVVGLIFFSAGASFYFMDFPRSPDPAAGRVYPLNNHGYITYLTSRERLSRYALAAGAILSFALSAYLKASTDKRSQ